MPAFSATGRGSERALCSNNLRLIGRALLVRARDHWGMMAWRVTVADGGTQAIGKPGNVWYEFAWHSNELASPHILVCPSDAETPKVARDFGRLAEGGFLNPAFRDNAVSYWIGLDAGYVQGNFVGPDQSANHVLSGDRNLRVDSINGSCSSGVLNAAGIDREASATAWTNGVHGQVGNMLFMDGRVETLSTPRWREAKETADDAGLLHMLMPR